MVSLSPLQVAKESTSGPLNTQCDQLQVGTSCPMMADLLKKSKESKTWYLAVLLMVHRLWLLMAELYDISYYRWLVWRGASILKGWTNMNSSFKIGDFTWIKTIKPSAGSEIGRTFEPPSCCPSAISHGHHGGAIRGAWKMCLPSWCSRRQISRGAGLNDWSFHRTTSCAHIVHYGYIYIYIYIYMLYTYIIIIIIYILIYIICSIYIWYV